MNYLKNTLPVMSNIMRQGSYIIMPAALSALAQISLQDSRIGKIVGGLGLTVSGVNLMVSSGMPKTIKSWYWTNAKELESHSKTTFRWGAAAAGFLVTGFGIYHIATGILELTAPKDTHLHYVSNSKFSDLTTTSDTCEDKILKAKEQLLSCPEGQNLWNEVESKGSFSIRCTTSEEAPAGAMVWVEKREILLSETNEEMVPPLLFELNNLKRAEIASLIGKNQCNLDVDNYATTIEAIEYGTAKDTFEIADKCVQGGFWSNNLNQFEETFNGKSTEDWRSFQGYLESQEKNGHTDLYRMAWYENCNPKGLSEWLASNRDKWLAILAQIEGKNEL